MEVIFRKQARELHQVYYFTGVPCKNNHVEKRYTNTGICYGCKRAINQRNNSNNPVRLQQRCQRSYLNNKEKHLVRSQKWAKTNRQRSNEIKKVSKIKNRETYLAQAREYARLKRQDPHLRLSKNISTGVWRSLREGKRESWKTVVPYTLAELIEHLEVKFKPGMTWENYGKYWHVDHIKPLSWFDLSVDFCLAWGLSNLQPLEASLNYSKCNRYEG